MNSPSAVRIQADAKTRAWWTFLVSLGLDVAATVAAFLVTVIGDLEWTRTWWIMVGLGIARSIITGMATYFIRRFIKPAVS